MRTSPHRLAIDSPSPAGSPSKCRWRCCGAGRSPGDRPDRRSGGEIEPARHAGDRSPGLVPSLSSSLTYYRRVKDFVSSPDNHTPRRHRPLVEPAAGLTAEEVQRYSRHLLLPDVSAIGQRRLKNAAVLVI